MATKVGYGTVQSQGATQKVKIPSFFERIAIKISALWKGVNTTKFDQISDQYSKAHKTLYDERVISPLTYTNHQRYQAMCAEVDQHPTPKLTELKGQISQIRDEIASLNRDYQDTYDKEDIAYSYIGSGGSGYDGSADRSKISSQIQQKEHQLSRLNSALHTERKSIAHERGLSLFKSPPRAPDYIDTRTHQIYSAAAQGIKTAQAANPSLTTTEVAVLSMPLFMSDTQQKNLERFLS